jgi:dTDP-4-amino-4,6-dideoxygalactose transaminase
VPDPPGFIPIAKPSLDEREVGAAARAIRSGWVTQGPEVAALEQEFADYVGSRHACAVSSGTAALHLALRAVGVAPGTEVVTVSHSFIATANAVRYCGATPVFVDIDPATYNIDATILEPAITDRTAAILCVHQLGLPCDLRAVLAIARRRGIPVVEDAACALGSEVLWDGTWQRIGTPHSDVACFSLHPRKAVTTGDGGMLTTRNVEWDAAFRRWRQHGMSVSDSARHRARDVVFESYMDLGYNYRLTDIQAAVGREQLQKLPEVLRRRRKLAERYHRKLREVQGVGAPVEPSWARGNWQSYCIRLPQGRDQRAVMQRMLDRNVATRRAVMCAHREPAYGLGTWSCGAQPPCRGGAVAHCTHLRRSEAAQDGAILLPLFADLSESDQDRVVEALGEACAAG